MFSYSRKHCPGEHSRAPSVPAGQHRLPAEIPYVRSLPPDNQTPDLPGRITVPPSPRLPVRQYLPSDSHVSRRDRETNIGSTRKRFPWAGYFFGKTQHSFIPINSFAPEMKMIFFK
ncbi:hypothetical protein BCEN4_2060002 [Burkholderia cenocepacia]|nr:hypothetical protein BCEN4_2060002 [Burkholderia cenocepacia]